MIEQTIIPSQGIVILKPQSALTKDDFIALTESVDAYLESHEKLNGLMIYAEEFPGWEDFDGFIGHMRFVRDHHQEIAKVALVSGAQFASSLPKLAKHFVRAEVKNFDFSDYEAGLKWLES